MALPELSPRLRAVAGLVLPGRPLADVGTDHAYLPAHLVAAGTVPRAIGVERLPGPLAAARRTVAAAGLAGRVELRLGDGLAPLAPGEADTLVLAGMGGALMARILAAGPAVVQAAGRLVLQPQADPERLRAWLAAAGWTIVEEVLVADGQKLYLVMAADPGAPGRPDAADLILGPVLRRRGGPLFRRYAERELAQARLALRGAERARRPDEKRMARLAERVGLLEEALAP